MCNWKYFPVSQKQACTFAPPRWTSLITCSMFLVFLQCFTLYIDWNYSANIQFEDSINLWRYTFGSFRLFCSLYICFLSIWHAFLVHTLLKHLTFVYIIWKYLLCFHKLFYLLLGGIESRYSGLLIFRIWTVKTLQC